MPCRRACAPVCMDFSSTCDLVEVLERADGEQHAVATRAEEGHCGIEQTFDVEGMDMFGRTELVRVREVDFQQFAYVI